MNLTIRMGAAYHDVTIEEDSGTSVFDLSTMRRGEKATVRRVITGALANAGVLNDRGGRYAVGRPHRRGKANAKRRRNLTKRLHRGN